MERADTTTPHGGAPTLDAMAGPMDSYEPLAKWLFEWRHRSKPYDEMMRISSPAVRENWLKVARNTAPTLAAALSRLSGAAADAAGLVKEARREREIMFMAPSGGNAGDPSIHAANWRDKPHRVLYDACKLIDRLCDALSTLPAAAGGDLTPAVGGVALPGVEEIAEALWHDNVPGRIAWTQFIKSPHAGDQRTATDYRARAGSLRTRIADHQARPAAPEGVDERLRAALKAHHDWHLAQGVDDGEPTGVNLAEAYSETDLCSRTVAALASSAPAGGVELQPTAPVDRVREAAEAAFSAWLGDEYGSDVLADAMGNLRAALDAGDGGAAAGDGWRDIATAPKDGTEIILADRLDVCAGFWSTVENRRSWADPAGNWFAEMDRGDEAGAKPLCPHRWQPLPAPPTTSTTTGTEGRDHG